MLATEILIKDHREVMDLIEQLENAEEDTGEAYNEFLKKLAETNGDNARAAFCRDRLAKLR